MINFRQYRHSLFLLALGMVCAEGIVQAQESVPGTIPLPVVLDRKQAEGLVMTGQAPEYPPVAKVNYLQGQVQLEVTVNGEGKVASVHVLQGDAILAESAQKATSRWTYHPLATPSGPSGFVTKIKMKFTLHSANRNLTPPQAERDFLRQVKPPQVVRPPEGAHPEDAVHMRLLVNPEGQVVDMDVLPMDKARFEAARETLRTWSFRPAHWGNIPIASYLDVDVPLRTPRLARATASPRCR